MLKNVLKSKKISCLIATAIYFVLVLPFFEALAFNTPILSNRELIVSYGLKILFAPILYFIFYFLLNFAEQLKNGNLFYIVWLRFFVIYLGFSVLILLMLYPGYWVFDEFYTLEAAQAYATYPAWQNYLTTIYHTFCQYLIPSGVSIVIVQTLFGSIAIGYSMSKLYEVLTEKRLVYIALIPFLFFPVLLNNFYPLRLTFYAYLLLIVLVKIVFLLTNARSSSKGSLNPYANLIMLTFFISLLAFWRSEGALYLLLIPLVALRLGILSKKPSIMSLKVMAACVAIVLLIFAIVWKTSVPRYQVPVTVNPLSTMLQKDLSGPDIEEKLDDIDKVIAVSHLREMPSYTDVPAMWAYGLKPDYLEHLPAYNRAFAYIVLHNIPSYLDNRLKTFAYTNGFGGQAPFVHGGLGATYSGNYEAGLAEARFRGNNILATPINKELRLKTIKFLSQLNNDSQMSFFGRVIWSVIPTLVLLLITSAILAIRKKWMWFTIFTLLLAHFVILFLTAPANFFMYYFPIYLVGNFLLTMLAVKYVDHHFKSKQG